MAWGCYSNSYTFSDLDQSHNFRLLSSEQKIKNCLKSSKNRVWISENALQPIKNWKRDCSVSNRPVSESYGVKVEVATYTKSVYGVWYTVYHTGPKTKFDKFHSKEAIVMWSDMHSFRYFDTFVLQWSCFDSLTKSANQIAGFCQIIETGSRGSFWLVVSIIWQKQKCKNIETNVYQITWQSLLSNGICQISF